MNIEKLMKDCTQIKGWFRYPKDFEALYSIFNKTVSISGHILEIGSFHGRTSVFLCKLANEMYKKLYTVDIFKATESTQKASSMVDKVNQPDYNQFKCFYDTMKKYNCNPIIFMAKSEDILDILPDNYFSLIFIDGDHSYEGIKKDLNFYNKLAKGGILCGHDYDKERKNTGVSKAVHEFATKENLDIVDYKDSLVWSIE